MEEPDYILRFQDGLMRPLNESPVKTVIKILLGMAVVLFLLGVLLFGVKLVREITPITWVFLLAGILYLKSRGGYVREPSPCELWFYRDYLVQYCPRRYYNRRMIRREYYKFYYKDITKCLYRARAQKFDIFGKMEFTYYKYDKNGNLPAKPYKQMTVESVSVFYTVFEPEIDFVREIEFHSPIRVEYEEEVRRD